MTDAEKIKRLSRALEDAVLTSRACRHFVDEQAGRFFNCQRPNWKKAAVACFDECDGKDEEWEDLLKETALPNARV